MNCFEPTNDNRISQLRNFFIKDYDQKFRPKIVTLLKKAAVLINSEKSHF
jgi:hypothetical protein